MFVLTAIVLACFRGTVAADSAGTCRSQSLLQTGASENSRKLDTISKREREIGVMERGSLATFPEKSLYGLGQDQGDGFHVSCEASICALNIPNATIQERKNDVSWTSVQGQVVSEFLNGKLPEILPKGRTLEALDGASNPSLIALPINLKSAFPDGHWLLVCGWWAIGSNLSVLNSSFDVLAQTSILFLHGDTFPPQATEDDLGDESMKAGIKDGFFIADGRLLDVEGEGIFLSYSAYFLAHSAHANESDWLNDDTQLISKLHLKAPKPGQPETFLAYISRYETRHMVDCPEKGLVAPGAKKNFGFFPTSQGIVAMDWIYPTAVGRVNLSELAASEFDHEGSLYIQKMCYGLLPKAVQSSVPWGQTQAIGCSGGLHGMSLHNGPNLIWIDELQEFLGIGHFTRSCGHFDHFLKEGYALYGHHYTHLFFTLSAEQPHQLRRIGAREFCMESLTDTDDCDLIQFVSGLSRDKDNLVISYGVMDRSPAVMTLKLGRVLEGLQAYDA